MNRIILAGLFVGALVLGFAGTVSAEVDVQSELATMKARIAELEGAKQQSWLNERRAEEVKSLIREVLADAETRASLLENGMYAGHDGKHFFLKSADGGFLMNISGQIQIRHIWNNQDGQRDSDNSETSITSDDNDTGFAIRRAKLKFSGHIADPRIKYAIQLAVSQENNTVSADLIKIGYQLTDTIAIWGGEDKAPFLREEITDSKYQLAIERSYANELFTADTVQGVWAVWEPHDQVKVVASINDGFNSGNGSTNPFLFTQTNLGETTGSQDEDRDTSKLFNEDGTDFAITARVDVRLDGEWSQMKDFSSWSGEELAIFIGAALHYEVGETGDGFFNNDFFAWTIDGSIESNGWSLFASFMMNTTDLDDGAPASFEDYDLWTAVVQGAYNIPMGEDSLEPFIRWEHIDFDGLITDIGANSEDEIDLLTFGANWYLQGHNAKVSFDVVWAFDPLPLGNSSTHLLADAASSDDQIALRTQFQLLF
jgi:hypothetical protein